MKTAMQELIEYLDPIHSGIKDRASELLEKEKKQMLDAMRYALNEDGHNGSWIFNFIESYYKKMYENE